MGMAAARLSIIVSAGKLAGRDRGANELSPVQSPFRSPAAHCRRTKSVADRGDFACKADGDHEDTGRLAIT
ncbi:MAG: hypothetical protein ACREEP_09440, partial [Dongiaceae bacterium]